MRELKILTILVVLIIAFFSGLYLASKINNFMHDRRSERAFVQVKIGMSSTNVVNLFKGCKIHKETLRKHKDRSEEAAKNGFMSLLGEVQNTTPEDLFDRIKFDGTVDVIWIPYNVRTEWFVGYFADIILIFYDKKENKIIGWCTRKDFIFSDRNFTEDIF